MLKNMFKYEFRLIICKFYGNWRLVLWLLGTINAILRIQMFAYLLTDTPEVVY